MEKQQNYILGIIGGLLGGIIASIPWILMYLYGNMMFSALAIIIALGALYGYRLFKGKQDEKLAIIITMISFVSITLATLVIIPMGLLAKNGYHMDFSNLKWLYQNGEFTGNLMRDYFISVVFTFLGISGVTAEIKKSPNSKFQLGTKEEEIKEETFIMKEIFQKKGAMNKERAVEKEDILNETNNLDAKTLFRHLCMQRIIRKYKGKYYFDETCEENVFKRFILIYWTVIKWILFFALVIIIPLLFL